jgi:signal transduction histidine kinase
VLRSTGEGPQSACWDEAVARLLAELPPEVADLGFAEIASHIDWIGAAMDTGAVSSDDVHGVTVVARRRVLELLRAELVRYWAAAPPDATAMIDALSRLERVRAACTPTLDQAFTAELADYGGLDLVVEVAHDMRSPLTSILFLSEILHSGQSGAMTPLQKRQVGIVYSAALGLVSISSDMIEMARGGSRLMGDKPVPFSVNAALRSVQGLVQPMAEEKGIELRVRKLQSENRVGYSIPLGRVLLNLATNALKYTTEGLSSSRPPPLGGNVVEFWWRTRARASRRRPWPRCTSRSAATVRGRAATSSRVPGSASPSAGGCSWRWARTCTWRRTPAAAHASRFRLDLPPASSL